MLYVVETTHLMLFAIAMLTKTLRFLFCISFCHYFACKEFLEIIRIVIKNKIMWQVTQEAQARVYTLCLACAAKDQCALQAIESWIADDLFHSLFEIVCLVL